MRPNTLDFPTRPYMLASRQSPPSRFLPRNITITYSSPEPPSSASSPRKGNNRNLPLELPSQQPGFSQALRGGIPFSVANKYMVKNDDLKRPIHLTRPPNFLFQHQHPIQPVRQPPGFPHPQHPDYNNYQYSNPANPVNQPSQPSQPNQPSQSNTSTRREESHQRDSKSKITHRLRISKQLSLTFSPGRANSIKDLQHKETSHQTIGTNTTASVIQQDLYYTRRPRTPAFLEISSQGLKNISNNCYMNAVLQVLFVVLKQENFDIKESKQVVTQRFFDLKSNRTLENTLKLIEVMSKYLAILASFGRQQDTHEFLLQLLERLGEQNQLDDFQTQADLLYIPTMDIKENYLYFMEQMDKQDRSPITLQFSGEILQRYACLNGHISYKFTRYIDLDIPVSNSKDPLVLRKLIQESLGPEIAYDYRCTICNNDQVKKAQRLYRSPNCLILHLMRFIPQENWKKDSRQVFFDQTLTIRDNSGPVTYDLMGIVSHVGTKQSGHYFSYVRNQEGWKKYNDETVLPFQFYTKECSSADAYIFVYSKQK